MRDNAFVGAFESLTLPPDQFDHAAHVRLAWIYLKEMPLPEAMQRYRDGLKAFAAQIGKPGKYNETITFALLALIRERMNEAQGDADWDAFRTGNPDLFNSVPDLLRPWYSDDVLQGAAARSGFVMPDRRAP